ncbi:hypothetical protein [Streptomyces clavifer]|uniref:hypothetical protein n=1 Tax=Streptomyces clavifer TaxID=68188 RepID=UPI00364CAF0F
MPGKLRTAPGGQLDCQVTLSDGPGTSRPVAHVERESPPGGVPAYLAARRSGARSLVLSADEHRQARVATLVTVSARGDGYNLPTLPTLPDLLRPASMTDSWRRVAAGCGAHN